MSKYSQTMRLAGTVGLAVLMAGLAVQAWRWWRDGSPSGGATGHSGMTTVPTKTARQGLGHRVSGFVVWESNRSGQWQLYRINTDGCGLQQLTHLAQPANSLPYSAYLRPRISPDGQSILFAYGSQGQPVETWLVPTAGGPARKLTVGNPLNWIADGEAIALVRKHRVWRYELATAQESLLHPAKVPISGREGNQVGDLHPDLKAAVFRPNGNHNVYFEFGQNKSVRKLWGCEPRFSADGRYLYWVLCGQHFYVREITSNKAGGEFFGVPPVARWNYSYFPTISADNRWLAYAASPGEMNHAGADYEIYVQELKDWRPVGLPVRLSWHPSTDRWPVLWTNTGQPP